MNENLLGIIAGVLTSISMIPQLIKVIRERKMSKIFHCLCFWFLFQDYHYGCGTVLSKMNYPLSFPMHLLFW